MSALPESKDCKEDTMGDLTVFDTKTVLQSSRRSILKTLTATAVALGSPSVAKAGTKIPLRFSVWGDVGSTPAFKHLIELYHRRQNEIEVTIEVLPFNQYYQQLDTSIAGRQAPDVVRFEYQLVGRYARGAALLDLTPYLPAAYGDDFLPTFWKPLSASGGVYAIPQNTDTFGIFYNREVLNAAGVKAPSTIDKSWDWEEFTDIAAKLLQQKRTPYPFAMAWQSSEAYRWLPFLYQHGGRLLSKNQKTCMLGSKNSVETIAWTQSWFKRGLVPSNTSIKSQEQPNVLFANGTLGMYIGGDWDMAALIDNIGNRFEWGATYMPRNAAMASDLGGSCIGISRSTAHPEAAADFLKYLSTPESQQLFVSESEFLPVRRSLIGRIQYRSRPEDRQIFVEQAETVPLELALDAALPTFGKVNLAMADQLDLAFTAGQSPTLTAASLESSINDIVKG
jgi:multiple sugar transport system substrate-binding protein